MENAIINLPEDQEQMVWLIDFHGFNISHISLKVTKETAHVLQEHYPERLGVAILYDAPKIFEPFWKVFHLIPSVYYIIICLQLEFPYLLVYSSVLKVGLGIVAWIPPL